MKKKLLLIALPALMVLAGCSGHAVEPKAQDDGMIEDTLLHEEIFGALPEKQDSNSKELAPRRALAPGQLYTPVLSSQSKTNGDGTFSVRFVATIEDSIVSATWYRSVHTLAGSTTGGKVKDDLDVQTVYRALNNNGHPAYANAETAIEDAGETPFSYYAVYCLLNIPADKTDFYVDAYIEVSDGSSSKKSAAGVLNVADDSKRMTYSITGSNRDAGFINGVEKANDSSGNKVAFEPVTLTAGDEIEVFYIDEDNLTITKNDSLTMPQAFQDFSMDTANDILTVTHTGEYKVYVTQGNEFWFVKKIYLHGGENWDEWGGNHYDTWIQFKPNDGYTYHDGQMTATGTPNEYYYWIDQYYKYNDIQFHISNNEKWTGYIGGSLSAGNDLYTYTVGWSQYPRS